MSVNVWEERYFWLAKVSSAVNLRIHQLLFVCIYAALCLQRRIMAYENFEGYKDTCINSSKKVSVLLIGGNALGKMLLGSCLEQEREP